ncbi:MAG: SDR family oxidoreductase [Pseudonocardia sp.]|uniref:SDR family oxidoreductase n=1 Tax=unclassified Pseudonocardia TaxID=2619320 RepID=UPI00086B844B|nr:MULTISPECIES: SDR family oxidoreductase [unclassified Pseudonocardia]MBN9109982.1 SDR family oxidoreductase [Pseudonocardia sp.]ODU25381.1 MAG: NAD(P)-dependent oxidoreductase [Pseudonocardia sp. SCN 72-51]ODV03300.1 MAG: NAD(P)-dependent oxidoreductase [Pseudonocardia sp. SCN 73-27]
MTIVVTGATGHLGRAVVESLLDRGVPADEILATGRNREKLAELRVPTRVASYDDPESLRAAFAGADKVLFVSGNEVGKRIPQHRNVVDAAKAAGVGRVVYTSAPKADTSDMLLVTDHRETEKLLAASGMPTTFLRNGWYVENYDLADALERGLSGASGDGRISIAPRSDYAEAAAAALLLDDPKPVYELGGESVTLAELAAEVSRQSGREVAYTDLSVADYHDLLLGAGLPEEAATVFADVHRATSEGALEVRGDDLASLLGRPATPLATAVKNALG